MLKNQNKIKAKVLFFNQDKECGEAMSEKGQKIIITKKSFDNEKDLSKLKPEVEIQCEVYNNRQSGLYAYSSTVIQ